MGPLFGEVVEVSQLAFYRFPCRPCQNDIKPEDNWYHIGYPIPLIPFPQPLQPLPLTYDSIPPDITDFIASFFFKHQVGSGRHLEIQLLLEEASEA